MNYRNVLIEDNKTITTADTLTKTLNIANPISRLNFKFNIANHATTPVIIAHPARAVSKIQIVDGAHIITSLSAEEMLAANYYDRRASPQSYINGVTATQSFFTCGIDFGRFLWDPELALKPGDYDSLQLKYTFDKALYESSATAMYVTISADVFDQKSISPRGYLRRYEATTWTPSGTAVEPVSVPVDLPIRKLLVAGYSTTKDFRGQVHSFKLSEDGDDKVPFDTNTRSYMAQMQADLPPLIESVICVGATGTEVIYTMPSYEGVYIGLSTAAEDVFLTSYVADKLTIDCATGANRLEGLAKGWIPFHTFELPLGLHNDIDDWYVAGEVKKLELQAKASTPGTSPVGRLIMEQLATH